MKDHWTTKHGLCSSKPLERLWTIMAETFNSAIVDAANDVRANWRILQPPTGSGKTTGACLFAAMQAERNRASDCVLQPVGSIVVTRLIEDADGLAATINEQAGRAVAIAHHSANPKSADALAQHDTLVITHQAYLNASATHGDRWERLTSWRGGMRLLTIVDEALANVVESAKVTSCDITRVQSYISADLQKQFWTECVALQILRKLVDRYAEASETGHGFTRGVWSEGVNEIKPSLVNFHPLRRALKGIAFDKLGAMMEDTNTRVRIGRKVDETLEHAQALFDNWAYYAKSGDEHAMHSSALAVPWDAPGPVVLDATARADFLWDLFEDRALRIPTPSHVRDYSNVTLHVARASGVGKRNMRENFSTRFPRLLADLEGRLSPDRSIFVCLHKDNRPLALDYAPQFAQFSIGHWGKVDGSNAWKDFDTAVIFGLPYRDQVWSNDTFFALQGFQEDGWFNEPQWKHYGDVRRVMRQRQLSVSIIQAIGRIRLRRVVDENGKCPPADVFIVLPKSQEGDEVLQDILTDLPGLKLADWDFSMDGPKVRKPRKGSPREALIAYMEQRLPGAVSMSKVASDLSLDKGKREKVREQLSKPSSGLSEALKAIGVAYRVDGRGRGAKSFLVKQQPA
ncbi:hypothetical protein GWE18_03470 [Bradyrhizobium sp. CSA112]|uniref:hypothetical protein n=1 Tax=Bradyrhizobium sp. CSA112 TaxID=2699170 RepID=UPI0023B13DC5|nr:hypothetical protein [Bradyrhizobium sp. CSA112]MDE5451937.1 hypothetical protein [Bradyrhizobium sp. CSA112]